MFHRNKKLLVLFSINLFIVSFIFISKAFAVTVSVINLPSDIKDENFIITASISGASLGQNYLRVDLYKDGTSNYFGETFNGLNWYSGSDGKLYFPVTIDSSKIVLATVTARLGDPEINDYLGKGMYKLKLRRYTSSGSQASDQQTPVDIQINLLTPTPESSSAPSPTSQSSPTASPNNSFSPVPSASYTELHMESSDDANLEEDVLGETSQSAFLNAMFVTNSPVPKKREIFLASEENTIPKILIFSGLVSILCCAILFSKLYYKKIKKQNE